MLSPELELAANIAREADSFLLSTRNHVHSFQSALGLLADLTRSTTVTADSEEYKGIYCALEAVREFHTLNTTYGILKILEEGSYALPSGWTDQSLQAAKRQTRAAIISLEHTRKLENAIRLRNKLAEDLDLEDGNELLTTLEALLLSAWACSYQIKLSHGIADTQSSPQEVKDDGLGQRSISGGGPLLGMPGSSWGLLSRTRSRPFFHKEEEPAVTFKATYYASILRRSTMELYARVLGQPFGQAIDNDSLDEESIKRNLSVAKTAGLPLPLRVPMETMTQLRVYGKVRMPPLKALEKAAAANDTGAYTFDFLSHLLRSIGDSDWVLGTVALSQIHSDWKFISVDSSSS